MVKYGLMLFCDVWWGRHTGITEQSLTIPVGVTVDGTGVRTWRRMQGQGRRRMMWLVSNTRFYLKIERYDAAFVSTSVVWR